MAFPGFKLRVANQSKRGAQSPVNAEPETVETPGVATEPLSAAQGSETPKSGAAAASDTPQDKPGKAAEKEIGGPQGPEPTRFGDWEKNGRCYDF